MYHKNPEKIKIKRNERHLKNPNYNKQYYIKNKDKIKQKRNLYKLQNPEKIKQINKKSTNKCRNEINYKRKKRRLKDICFKLRCNLSSSITKALKRNQKHGHTVQLIMCTIPELKLYIESLWLPGMSWNNYGFGNDKWNIDHIIPKSFFNLIDPVEQYMCCRWQNLQPMWQTDNFKKGNRIIQEEYHQLIPFQQ